MTDDAHSKIIAEVGISTSRKFLLVAALFGLGIVILGLSWTTASSVFGRSMLFAMGAFCLFQGERTRRAPDVSLQLTAEGLYQSDGVIVAEFYNIKGIDRGALTIKPSNGFMLSLNEKRPGAWFPGLWWRLQRKIGVGGIVNAGAAKFMAEQIALLVKPKS